MRLTPRKRLLVDPKLQGALLLRTFGYWCFCVITFSLILLCWDAATGPPQPFIEYFRVHDLWREHGTVMFAAVVLLPVLLIDVLLTTNRLAGPLYRLRRSLRALAAGEHVEPVQFRQGDFWQDVADEFNAVAVYVDSIKKDAATGKRPDKKETLEIEPLQHC